MCDDVSIPRGRRTGAGVLAALGVAILSLGGCGAEPRQISQSGAGAYEASLGVLDDGFVAAWHDTRDGHPAIYVRTLDATGRPDGPERRLTDSSDFSYEADIEVAGADLVVAWYEETAAGGGVGRQGRPLDARRRGPVGAHALDPRAQRAQPFRSGRR